ncbi:hypothetical protein P7K49_018411, partial [Saguinus oedipus]
GLSHQGNFIPFAIDTASGRTFSRLDIILTKEIDWFKQGKIRNKISTCPKDDKKHTISTMS